jgi:hypothetical protein
MPWGQVPLVGGYPRWIPPMYGMRPFGYTRLVGMIMPIIGIKQYSQPIVLLS